MNEREQRIFGLASAGMIPSGFAEKAMASLVQLHSELMDEKERRVDLYRRLSEKDQLIAELRMQVRLLEERDWANEKSSVRQCENEVQSSKESSFRPPTQHSGVSTQTRSAGWKQW